MPCADIDKDFASFFFFFSLFFVFLPLFPASPALLETLIRR
jgi:hypothetical protein